MDSKALTKIQSVALIAIIVVAAVGGSLAYMFWVGPAQSTETIKIGVCGDLDMPGGKATWQGALLAAEQANAQGGVLGRNLTVVAEDSDDEVSSDIAVISNALTKLITVDKADYIVTSTMGIGPVLAFQDVSAEHKKIIFSVRAGLDNLTQRVLDNYDRYKYYFRVGGLNSTVMANLMLDYVLTVGNYTGFTKVATLFEESPTSTAILKVLNASLPKHGFEVVYLGHLPALTTDFTSYFAAIEASGAEILVPGITSQAAAPFVKEWYYRQSPVVVWGLLAMVQDSDFWELTEGKCQAVSFSGYPAISGYPLTNKTVPTREAYIQRWGEVPTGAAVAAYDTVRFILPDAIKRAGTTETEALIKALETTDIETSMARHFAFTTSHDVMIGAIGSGGPDEDHVTELHVPVAEWNPSDYVSEPDESRGRCNLPVSALDWTMGQKADSLIERVSQRIDEKPFQHPSSIRRVLKTSGSRRFHHEHGWGEKVEV